MAKRRQRRLAADKRLMLCGPIAMKEQGTQPHRTLSQIAYDMGQSGDTCPAWILADVTLQTVGYKVEGFTVPTETAPYSAIPAGISPKDADGNYRKGVLLRGGCTVSVRRGIVPKVIPVTREVPGQLLKAYNAGKKAAAKAQSAFLQDAQLAAIKDAYKAAGIPLTPSNLEAARQQAKKALGLIK